MKKYQVTFWTNVILEEGEQQSFKKVYEFEENQTIADVAIFAYDEINSCVFVNSSIKPNHFFRTSTVTDFEIKELEE